MCVWAFTLFYYFSIDTGTGFDFYFTIYDGIVYFVKCDMQFWSV